MEWGWLSRGVDCFTVHMSGCGLDTVRVVRVGICGPLCCDGVVEQRGDFFRRSFLLEQ